MLEDPRDTGWPLDPRAYRRLLRSARRLRPYFQPSFHGFDVFQRSGGMVVVSNHGQFAMEIGCLYDGVWQAARRPIRGLGDKVLYRTKLQRVLLGRSGGGLEGTPENAHLALTRGEAVYVNPGGAREALADATDRYRLFWDGHYGFVRAAIRASVPIVPLACIGSDDLYRQLLGRDEVAATGFGRAVRELLGEKYVTPLYVGLGPFPFPMPLRFHAGEPIEVPDDPRLADDDVTVERLHAEAKHRVEALIREGLAARRKEFTQMPDGPEKSWLAMLYRFADVDVTDAEHAATEAGLHTDAARTGLSQASTRP